ncbi:MAG: acyl carrier protein [Myxococcota bacterium]
MTPTPDQLAQIRQIIAQHLSVQVELVTDETSLGQLGADPLDWVEIIMAMEDALNVVINFELGPDSTPESLPQTALDLAALLKTAHAPSAQPIEAPSKPAQAPSKPALLDPPLPYYEPVLHTWPSEIDGRWQVIRELLRRWHGVDLPPALRTPERLANAETARGQALPHSAQEWVRLLDQVERGNVWGYVFRDCWSLTPVPGHSAFSLLVQGEADLHWAIADDDATLDPAVRSYSLDYDDPSLTKFELQRQEAPSITEWALAFILRYLGISGSRGFEGWKKGPFDALAGNFPHQLRIGPGRIFEDRDMIVFADEAGPRPRVYANAQNKDALKILRARVPLPSNVSWGPVG